VTVAPESVQGIPNLSAESDKLASVRQDEEGDWISDQSSLGETQVGREHQHSTKSARGRGGKKRRTHRQRPSLHSRIPHLPSINASTSTESSTARIVSSPTPTPDVSTLPIPETPPYPTDVTDEPRGRPPPTSVPSTYGSRRQPRHMRVVSLRESGETGSRDASPARSVRWADAGAGTSPPTARWSRHSSAQGSRAPSPGPPTPAEPVGNDSG
jgi:hypothetical protein